MADPAERPRHRRRALAAPLVLIAAGTALAGCGSGHQPIMGSTGTTSTTIFLGTPTTSSTTLSPIVGSAPLTTRPVLGIATTTQPSP